MAEIIRLGFSVFYAWFPSRIIPDNVWKFNGKTCCFSRKSTDEIFKSKISTAKRETLKIYVYLISNRNWVKTFNRMCYEHFRAGKNILIKTHTNISTSIGEKEKKGKRRRKFASKKKNIFSS